MTKFYIATAIFTAICIIGFTESNNEINGPIFIKEPKYIDGFLNTKDTQLDCSAHGVPDPTIKWVKQNGFRNQEEVKAFPPLLSIFSNGSLVIHHFQPDQYRQEIHSAVYRCLASNIHGTVISHPISVKASTGQQQQQLQAQVYDEYVIPGNTAVLTCHIPSFYKENLKIAAWIREDNLIIKPQAQNDGLKMAANGQLLIENVSSNSKIDLGYWCQIRNKLSGENFLSQSAGKIKLTEHQGSIPPTISHITEKVTAKLGKPTELSCVGQGYPPPNYIWKSKDGNIISESSTLQIEDISKAGTYEYSCIAKNKFGRDERKSVVTVREILKAYILPSVQTVNSGETIKLECIISGHPVDEVVWNFNGKPLTESNGAMITKRKLKISSANGDNEGMYQCMVKNKWESMQTAAQVLLGDMIPEFTETFKSKTLQPGPSISLKCMAVGRPEPNISWKFNGKNLTKDSKYVLREKKMTIGSVKSIFVIKNVRSFDGGEYMCTASNEVGFVSFSQTIDVYGPPLVHDMNNVTVAAGEDIDIKCYISGYPISTIEWVKEADPFYQNFAHETSKKKNLRINGTTEEDEGYYTCKAENGRGLSSEKKLFLNVIKKPEITPLAIPPKLLKARSSYSILCSILSGDQPIKLHWLKDNDDISLIPKVYMTNTKRYSLLQIQELGAEHSGVYSCVAENDAGKSVDSIKITVSSPPRWLAQPKNIAAALNSEILLDCMAEGFPHPEVKWYKYKNKKIVQIFPFKNKDIFLHENGSIRINVSNKRITGNYSCIVSNGIKPDLVKMIFLDVIDPVQLFLRQLKDDKNAAVLECKANSNSHKLTLTWLDSKGKALPELHRFSVKQSKSDLFSILHLIINHPRNGEMFKCTASEDEMVVEKAIIIATRENLQDHRSTPKVMEDVLFKTSTVYSHPTKSPTTTVRKSKILEKIVRLDDASMSTNEAERKKNSASDQSSKEEIKKNMNLAESKSKEDRLDLKTLLIFVLPAIAVFVLLILLIVTLTAYLCTKKSNKKHRSESLKMEYSGIDTLNRSGNWKKQDDGMGSMARRYGRLERPLPIAENTSDPTYQNQYEIPDFYSADSEMKPYSTLQYSTKPPHNTHSMPRNSQASL